MNKSVPESASPENDLPHSEVCWALLGRVVASPQLKRAARLREFLLYVGQRSIKDGLDQIHEQEIGANVFARPADYDTSLDNIVRVNASELRKRIEDYFESDGASEPMVMEIPRGSYKPVFRERFIEPVRLPATEPAPLAVSAPATSAAAANPPLADAPPTTAPANNRIHRIVLVAAALLIVALASGCFLLWTQNRELRQSLHNNAWQDTPTVASFWLGILGARPNTDIILADTSFALIEDITKHSIPLNDYLTRNYVSKIESPNLSQDRRLDLDMIMRRNNGSLGDFRAAQRILALDPAIKNFRVYSARDYTPTLVNQDNIVLVGARKSNPWVDLFSGSMNFVADYDPQHPGDFIRNKTPQSGELATYTPPQAPSTGGYCVVAYLSNPQHSGKVLIIAGTDSAATEGGGDFLTSEEQLSRFLKSLHVASLPYFELVLKTSNLNGTPIGAEVVAYRTYSASH
jgi:hypothetical protein